ncbi:1659_t:CDS:2 [Funneliformis caledonium]|uniref:1659_t:CDS:1 n=1 Tax=Funneliformis caledonium TaxID=1117310 RepID=A0A9N9C769_9GLOM|nr:1659_t:CDS:2 [Funneliformis caledonium]
MQNADLVNKILKSKFMAPHNFENEASTTRFWIDIERNLQIFNDSLFKRLALMFGSEFYEWPS